MNCRVETSKVACLYPILALLMIACFISISGCGEGSGTVASQDELSTFLQANPEMQNSNASEEEGKEKKPEATEAAASSPRSDA